MALYISTSTPVGTCNPALLSYPGQDGATYVKVDPVPPMPIWDGTTLRAMVTAEVTAYLAALPVVQDQFLQDVTLIEQTVYPALETAIATSTPIPAITFELDAEKIFAAIVRLLRYSYGPQLPSVVIPV